MSPLERALVALLALTPARTVSTTTIVDALWGDHPPQCARTRVQALVSGVRRKLVSSADALANPRARLRARGADRQRPVRPPARRRPWLRGRARRRTGVRRVRRGD
ncbi:winged helix-turn-helix domain-containing protein [Micromonospora sp. NPDC050795]|uniref:winged helix-turn-helix domain-containing protein n=1 Tax=Micromonospora sp. NPDC050795 TaxID=3364282 RepID=UPI0037A418D6